MPLPRRRATGCGNFFSYRESHRKNGILPQPRRKSDVPKIIRPAERRTFFSRM